MKALGLDLGTTSLSAVVLETDSGVLAAKTVQNAAFLPGERWERTQNAEEIYAAALPLVQELVCEHPEICAIGVTGQMHGIVYLDTDGRCLSPLYTWQDERAALPFNETESWAAHLSAVTGYPAAPGYGLATHYYNVHHGLVPETAACFCTIADFVAMRLAGRTSPLLDGSNAASLGLFDLQNGCFDKDAAEKAGLSPHLLPQVSKNAYLGTGTFKIPVYTAIGDNQAAFLGAVDDRKHTLLVNVGTGSQVAVFTPGYLSVPGLETRPYPGGGNLLVKSEKLFPNLHTHYTESRSTVQCSRCSERERFLRIGAIPSGSAKPHRGCYEQCVIAACQNRPETGFTAPRQSQQTCSC